MPEKLKQMQAAFYAEAKRNGRAARLTKLDNRSRVEYAARVIAGGGREQISLYREY